jgi:hypothetical protein
MADKFHERFQISVPKEEARRRFVNRVGNEIFRSGGWLIIPVDVNRAIATELGEPWRGAAPEDYTTLDFNRTLQAIEGIFKYVIEPISEFWLEFDRRVQDLIQMAEVDLEITWQAGRFLPSGAKLLDAQLVNESLGWLREKRYQTVLAPFEKALNHLLRARAQPELLSDVVTDAYEALETLSKIITEKDRTLDANQELFISTVKASDAYKRILKEYIAYAHNFRHGSLEPKPALSYGEAESFVYLTGIFIRLAMA